MATNKMDAIEEAVRDINEKLVPFEASCNDALQAIAAIGLQRRSLAGEKADNIQERLDDVFGTLADLQVKMFKISRELAEHEAARHIKAC